MLRTSSKRLRNSPITIFSFLSIQRGKCRFGTFFMGGDQRLHRITRHGPRSSPGSSPGRGTPTAEILRNYGSAHPRSERCRRAFSLGPESNRQKSMQRFGRTQTLTRGHLVLCIRAAAEYKVNDTVPGIMDANEEQKQCGPRQPPTESPRRGRQP